MRNKSKCFAYTLGMIPFTVLQGNYIHDSIGRPGGVCLDEGAANLEVTANIVRSVPKSMNYDWGGTRL
jgi:hypothetical protein